MLQLKTKALEVEWGTEISDHHVHHIVVQVASTGMCNKKTPNKQKKTPKQIIGNLYSA